MLNDSLRAALGSAVLMMIWGALPHFAEEHNAQVWATRVQETAVEVLGDETVPQHTKSYVRDMSAHILAARGFDEEAVSFAEMQTQPIFTRYVIAGAQAARGDLDTALKTLEPLKPLAKQSCLPTIACRLAERGDVDGVHRVLALTGYPEFRPDGIDLALKTIGSKLSDRGLLEEARAIQKRIKDKKYRAKLKERIENIGRLLEPNEPGYVEQQIKIATDFHTMGKQLDLIRALRSAEAAAAQGRRNFAQEQLEKALHLVKDDDPDERSNQYFFIAEIAAKADLMEIAADTFRAAIADHMNQEKPSILSPDLSLSAKEPEMWKRMGDSLSTEEIEAFIQQASAKEKMHGLVAVLCAALLAKDEREKLEDRYADVNDAHQRWKIALEVLRAL